MSSRQVHNPWLSGLEPRTLDMKSLGAAVRTPVWPNDAREERPAIKRMTRKIVAVISWFFGENLVISYISVCIGWTHTIPGGGCGAACVPRG